MCNQTQISGFYTAFKGVNHTFVLPRVVHLNSGTYKIVKDDFDGNHMWFPLPYHGCLYV